VAGSEEIPTWMSLLKCLFSRVICNRFEINVKVTDSGIAQKILDKIFLSLQRSQQAGNRIQIVLDLQYRQTHDSKIKAESTNGYENSFIAYFFLFHVREDPGSTIVCR
jgi:hypothetical protein